MGGSVGGHGGGEGLEGGDVGGVETAAEGDGGGYDVHLFHAREGLGHEFGGYGGPCAVLDESDSAAA